MTELKRSRTDQPLKRSLSADDDSTSTEQDTYQPPPLGRWATERRFSISAEVVEPLCEGEKREHKYVEKTEAQRYLLRKALERNILFDSVDKDQISLSVDVMEERTYDADDIVLRQGELNNNFFYVIADGEFEVTVTEEDNPDETVQVAILGSGDGFGENSLLYNAPMDTSVTCREPGHVWVMDRVIFHEILMDTTLKKRTLYKDFLAKVPLLEPLTLYERFQVADALTALEYEAGEYILYQGDQGDSFYIIEEGEAIVTKTDAQNEEPVVVGELGPGSYFGELALLMDQPRIANIVAKTFLKVLGLSRSVFTRLLGPCQQIVNRTVYTYQTIEQVTGQKVDLSDEHEYPELLGAEALEKKEELVPELRALKLSAKNLEKMAAIVFREAQILSDEVDAFIKEPAMIPSVTMQPGVEEYSSQSDDGINVDEGPSRPTVVFDPQPTTEFEEESEDESSDDDDPSAGFRRGSGMGMDMGPSIEDMLLID